MSQRTGLSNAAVLFIEITIVFLCALSAASAQQMWMKRHPPRHPAIHPTPLMEHDMVAVPGDQILLFGGGETKDGPFHNELWAWSGAYWSEITPAGPLPTPRAGHSICYDPLRDRVVLFSGWDGTDYLTDTWEWDGTSWQRILPPASPPGRVWFDMVYDTSLSQVILFGGYDRNLPGSGALGDFWAFDGSTWTEIVTSPMPSERWGHCMAHDGGSNSVLLMGGNGANEMWSWNGTGWIRHFPPTMPPGRTWATMSTVEFPLYDVCLYGGSSQGALLTDFWAYDGKDWTLVDSAGPAVALAPIVYDSWNEDFLVYGGTIDPGRTAASDETWCCNWPWSWLRGDVYVNESDDWSLIPNGVNATIGYNLLAGRSLGSTLEVWLMLRSPFGYFTYDGAGPVHGWHFDGKHPLRSGPLIDMSGIALDCSVPPGSYGVYIGWEGLINGKFDLIAVKCLDGIGFDVQ
jgi:hypothetical protein